MGRGAKPFRSQCRAESQAGHLPALGDAESLESQLPSHCPSWAQLQWLRESGAELWGQALRPVVLGLCPAQGQLEGDPQHLQWAGTSPEGYQMLPSPTLQGNKIQPCPWAPVRGQENKHGDSEHN